MKKYVSIILSALLIGSTFCTPGIQANAATTNNTSNANLLNTYGKVFGKVGNILNASQISDPNAKSAIKKEYNSVTAENEMKPDAILGHSANVIPVAQAKALGYYIPDNYSESTVPKLNFTTVDNMLKFCFDNGLSMRGHTLLWHSQTPDWYFRSGYNNNGGYVTPDVMNKRMEFYIKTVMNHVFSSKYGSVIYAWDVANEYLHAAPAGSDKATGWQKIYGNLGTKPAFVKQAFQYAYDTLAYYKLTNKVKLFYNDYNEYMEVDNIIKLINYINSDRKVCAGIGMQSHLSTNFPSVAYYKSALQAFAKAGFEIQITELDVGCTSLSEQSKYYYDLMSAILSVKKSGANISALVFWGLSDDHSWRRNDPVYVRPLLYSNYSTPKEAYNSVLKAFSDSAYGTGSSTTKDSTNTSGTTQTLSDGWYYIKNVNAQKYLQVANNVGKAAQNVELGTGSGAAGQKWYLKNVGNGYVTLKSALGNYMLDVYNGENKDGSNIRIFNAYSNNAQKFALKSSSTNGAYGITTMSSNQTKALDDYNFQTFDGANVCQWTYGGTSNQLWIFEAAK
ncbi:endo-1,4-beta-xylanase [Clostridium saccharobutylicum]|uniref:Beta-xylanase n=1 Tax=Clostridium saccharobutylicum DSM 13864 TaxID=1345695 RepID=U5MM60_CLOSA|nr:endo-1,4-beta-xylanase [Clostridium saccharobutylicum]AGX41685.1 endo-1,4-beta-xylanase A [Clostridium saccharobutylicum DSM 13864]AQR88968.1 endo-1,4-beta-xylanase Y precursor [Clostridium saccharobutylicum]AQR98869.1 endo-1,4-beta-xylanase Y precursor [Clostridium saccharobutylicum]AQS08588.1 endo-1,4-beta-xylanase Y precursor [Clostridium saccharobutylicum]AQS12857.1 endo-1,4-beta-xylanase Y precursor [Clostridium saccharobutylicum]